MERFIALIILCFLFGCQNSSEKKSDAASKESLAEMPELEGTQWQFKIADDCINYFVFLKDSNSVYYSCETEDKSYGKYYVNADTLYIHEYVTDSDSLLSANESEYRSEQAKYKLILKDNRLKHIERWSYSAVKDLWTKDNVDFGEDFLFEKVK